MIIMHSLAILSRDADRYRALIAAESLPDLQIVAVADSSQRFTAWDCTLLLGEPDLIASVVPSCTNLAWVQSTWAGNTPLIRQSKHDFLLTAAKGIFTTRIREYVFAYLLYFSRNMEAFHPRIGTPEAEKPLTWSPPVIGDLAGKRLGILGAGSMGSALIAPARVFGMHVIGLNRTGRPPSEAGADSFDALYTAEQRLAFATGLDYLVCLLPDTAETADFVDAKLLAALPSHCVLINAGRGNSVDTTALLAALDHGQIRAAVLDVFEREPLPDGDPRWRHPKVWITHHTAALSDPAAVSAVFAENYLRWRSGNTLRYQVNFALGY